MRVLVTGSEGFLGRYVAAEISNRKGLELIRTDKCPSNSDVDELGVFLKGDICDLEFVQRCVQNVDCVIHLAALQEIDEGYNTAAETAKVNVYGSVALMQEAVKAGVKNFIYSSSIYASGSQGSFYGSSKIAAEAFMSEFDKRTDTNFWNLRFGSLFGLGATESNGLFRILKNVKENGIVSYDGDRRAMREYIHVLDAAAIVGDIVCGAHEPGCYVVSGTERLGVTSILEMLSEMTGYPVVENNDSELKGHYRLTACNLNLDIHRKIEPVNPIAFDVALQSMLKSL